MKSKSHNIIIIILTFISIIYGCNEKERDLKPLQNDSVKSKPKIEEFVKSDSVQVSNESNKYGYRCIQRKQIGDYKISIIVPNDETNYLHDSLYVKIKKGKKIKVYNNYDLSCSALINIEKLSGTDINGDSIPELILEGYSGGAHCCYNYFIFKLDSTLELINTIPAMHSGIKFKDINNDGIYEIIMNDWTYAYFFTSFGSSPYPEVILSYHNGNYDVDLELMKRPLPSDSILKSRVRKVKKDTISDRIAFPLEGYNDFIDLSSLALKYFLDLLYQGHEDEAKAFIVSCWPKGDKRCKIFIKYLLKTYNNTLPKLGLKKYNKKCNS